MNPLRLVVAGADPSGLPAPVWLLTLLLLLTWVIHVVFMNVTLGGGILWTWATFKARPAKEARHLSADRTDEASGNAALAAALGRALPVATAFTITAGVAPLLFLQLIYGQLSYTSSVLMAWPWLAVVALLLAGYYANYAIAFRRGRVMLLGISSAVVFLAVGFVFTNNMTLMLRPEMHAPMYLASDSGLRANLADAWIWPRFLHMVVGAVAIAGLFVAWLGERRNRIEPGAGTWIRQRGGRIFRVATSVEFVVGLGYLFALPLPVREAWSSGSLPDPILLVVGAAFALGAVVVVSRSLLVASAAIVVALADMAIVRHRVRALMLEPYFQPDSLPVNPQMGALAIFAVLLVAGLGVVGWMVWRFLTGEKTAEGRTVSV